MRSNVSVEAALLNSVKFSRFGDRKQARDGIVNDYSEGTLYGEAEFGGISDVSTIFKIENP